MNFIKTKQEIILLKKAGLILAQTRNYLKKFLKPGVSTAFLDEQAEKFILQHEAKPSFKNYEGFPNSICTSINNIVIHGIPQKKQILKEGDLLSLDIGVCFQGYHADSAWTFIIGKKVSPMKKKLVLETKKALLLALKEAKPNNNLNDISRVIQKHALLHKFGLVQEFAGHGIGQKLHEKPIIPNYPINENEKFILKPGMTLCIEPIFNLGSAKIAILEDKWSIITQDLKASAHFEHTILITETGHEILTQLEGEK